MPYPHDDERDAARIEWNNALASGDETVIAATRDRLLRQVHVRIMDEDPNYRTAGWSPR